MGGKKRVCGRERGGNMTRIELINKYKSVSANCESIANSCGSDSVTKTWFEFLVG